MFKKPIIISDNYSICSKVSEIILGKNFDIKFSYGISPFSNEDDFPMDVDIFDMKKIEDVEALIEKHDLLISVHCKQLFPNELINAVKCINIHPGYNPINRGWYPQVFAIINDLVIGATIHEITRDLDNGPVIKRKKVKKYAWDTSLSLYNRVVDEEIELFDKCLYDILNNSYTTFTPKETNNLFLKKDFEELKQIKLDKKATYKEVIDHLRALTHGDYDNVFFIDRDTGKKIIVKISLDVK